MQLDLTKGMSLDLSKTENIEQMFVGANWGMIKHGGLFGFGATKEKVDLDISAIAVDERGNRIEWVFYGRKNGNGISLDKDDRDGDDEDNDEDNETLTIIPSKIDPRVAKVYFCLVSFLGQTFKEIPYATMRMYDKNHQPLANIAADIPNTPEFHDSTSIVFAALERTPEGWSYRAITKSTNCVPIEALAQIVSAF